MENTENLLDLDAVKAIIDKKVIELRNAKNCKIIPFLFTFGNEYIVGYATEPTRMMKSLAIGKMSKSSVLAGEELLRYCLILEESDSRLASDDSKYDSIIFGAAMKMINTIEVIMDECE